VFIAVLVYLAQHETSIRMTNLATLEDVLPGSQGYFALAAIPLREWFDPSVQLYLARLFAHQTRTSGFRHERVLLFLTRGSFLDVFSTLLDEHHARCLIKLHRQFGAQLAFLRPEELYDILDGLLPADKKALGYPKSSGWLVRKTWRLPWRTRRLIRILAFAEVTRTNGARSIVRFFKGPGELSVRTITAPDKVQPYSALIKRICAQIYLPGTTTLKAEYDFAKQLEL